MVKHGALSKSHVYHLLCSKDLRVRHAAFTLLETGYWLQLPVEPVLALPEGRTYPGYPHALRAAALFAA